MKVLPAVFSYEDMKRRFAQDNPDDPYTRRKDLESGIYELDKWLIRVDDNDKAISTVGWKEHPSHTVVGGMYATEYGESLGGNSKALQNAREPQLNQSKPLVAAFGHRRGDNARWIANAKKNLWRFPDDPEFEQMKTLLPESVLNAWLAKYPERMAIRSIRDEGQMAKCVYLDDPTPQWFSVMKSNYKRQLGKAGFNVIRISDGKRMNSKGLSRSQAIQMIDDLESGKDVSRYQKKKKSITGGWKGQLKKFYPTDDFDDVGIADKYGDDLKFPSKGIIVGNTIVMFSSHYLDGHNRKATISIPITSEVYNALIAKGKREMWAYVNDVEDDFTYVLVEYLVGSQRVNRAPTNKRGTPEDYSRLGVKAILNFYHYTEKGGLPTFRSGDAETKVVPIFYENEETNHIKPGHRIKR